MPSIFDFDWRAVFLPQTPLAEIFLRGSFIYLGLFALLRLVLKREAGVVGITDLLVVVLLADAAQNALADDYRSIPDGLLLVGVIIFWSYALNWLGYRFPRLRPFVHPPPLQLVRDGRPLHRNLRREFITEDELMSHIRQQGLEDLAEVKAVFMEGDGRISVIGKKDREPKAPSRKIS